MKKTGKQNIRWNTMKILAVGFLSVIFLGAVLLWLPVSNEKSISFLDALFTSTSSVCVTGLVTIVPKYQFTITGKVILLILIQIGGLGVIACITAFFMLLKRKITVKERVVIQEAYNMNSLGGLVGLVRKILIGTVVVEGIGAVFYAIQFIRDYGVAKGIWYGIFHSISAFCNAGIDILGDDSLARYATDPLINIITMLLIILGGIGFTVWYDVIDNGKKIWHREIPRSATDANILPVLLVPLLCGILARIQLFLLYLQVPTALEFQISLESRYGFLLYILTFSTAPLLIPHPDILSIWQSLLCARHHQAASPDRMADL